jgi:predicted lipid-binding transport protein (Tim44 family)
MGTDRRWFVSHTQAGVSPSVSTHPPREAPRRSTVLSVPALRAFADGFGGGLAGGLLYCLVLASFHPAELERAWLRVLALSLVFGGFEIWRVTRNRTLRNATTYMLWTVVAGLLLLLALESVISSADTSRQENPASFQSKPPRTMLII